MPLSENLNSFTQYSLKTSHRCCILYTGHFIEVQKSVGVLVCSSFLFPTFKHQGRLLQKSFVIKSIQMAHYTIEYHTRLCNIATQRLLQQKCIWQFNTQHTFQCQNRQKMTMTTTTTTTKRKKNNGNNNTKKEKK